MVYSALGWTLLNLFSILILGFYSMTEMACISFNKIRLQWYVAKGNRRAILLNYLLRHPAYLFGTTLIGVNIAMVFGSECARKTYEALNISGDFAPLTQIIIVIIFAELAPQFAARRFSEHTALLGSPILYASAMVMLPLIWILKWISDLSNKILSRGETKSNIFITPEEIERMLESRDEEKIMGGENQEFNTVTNNIFTLRNRKVVEIMHPLKLNYMLPSNATVANMRRLLQKHPLNIIPIYNVNTRNVVAIVRPRDLVRTPSNRRIRNYSNPPWFVTQNTSLIEILEQFRKNRQKVAIILNEKGQSVGIVSLDDIVNEVFGRTPIGYEEHHAPKTKKQLVIDKTLPGNMTVGEFNKQFGVTLSKKEDLTFSELMTEILDHHPEKGESIYIEPFELTAKETTLLTVKSILVKTRI